VTDDGTLVLRTDGDEVGRYPVDDWIEVQLTGPRLAESWPPDHRNSLRCLMRFMATSV